MLNPITRAETEDDWRGLLKKESQTAFLWLRLNAALNFVIRIALYGMGIFFLYQIIIYVLNRADPMVEELLNAVKFSNEFDFTLIGKSAAAVTWPVAILVGLAAFCIILGLFIQRRSNAEFERGQEVVGRLRRDSVGVPRARALSNVLEETLLNSKRAFTVQIWLSRTLFLSGIVLLGAFVLNGIAKGDAFMTTAFGLGSLGAIASAAVLNAGGKVGTHLADVTQLQMIVIGSMRQVGLLEEHVYHLLEAKRASPEEATGAVTNSVNQLATIYEAAISRIQKYAEPKVAK
jgi:type IV secretory pathway TrbD component